jgi:hypothetical protein
MITAGITASVAALLSLFGIKPGAYLVGVAIAVKVTLVAVGLVFGSRILRRRAPVAISAARQPSVSLTPGGPIEAGSSDP